MDTATAPSATTRGLAGQHVVVTGAGVSGRGCVRTLVALGAAVTVVDANEENLARALSECPDAKGMTSDAALGNVRDGTLRPDFVVTSPGWRPDSPVLVAFQQHGIEVIGDVELAWRLDRAGRFGSPRTWLAVTGTNGKTTTTGMLAEIMQADAQATGRRAEPAGNIGRSVFELLADSDRVDVLVVELSSFQLHWSTTLAPHVGVLLNVAGDHLDWHGSLESYAAAKGKILSGEVAVLGRDDAAVVQQADRLRAIGGGIIGTIAFLVFMYILIAAWSNAVNLTDGLDGLAAGSTALTLGAYVIITFWQFRNSCAFGWSAGCYEVRDPLDLAVLAAAGLGGCLGFLWWNAAPAKIFMGDTGSLALGGLVAGLSVTTRTELLMIIIGALFVVEAASVVIQVAVFRTTKRRFFRMAPIHHHFENGGWPETAVVIRFWLLSGMAAMGGAALFYGEWLQGSGLGL